MNVIGQRQPVRDAFDCRWRNETKVRHCVCWTDGQVPENISFVVLGNGSVTRSEKWIRQRVWCQCKGTGANARCETNVRFFTCRVREGGGWAEEKSPNVDPIQRAHGGRQSKKHTRGSVFIVKCCTHDRKWMKTFLFSKNGAWNMFPLIMPQCAVCPKMC